MKAKWPQYNERNQEVDPWIAFFEGDSPLPKDVEDVLLKQRHQEMSAGYWQHRICEELKQLGYTVEMEKKVFHYVGGNVGFVDLYVYSTLGPIAIELDRLKPRDKSIMKLRALNATRVVVCKYGKPS